MKKYLTLCLGSAVLGAVLTEFWRAASHAPLVAQEPRIETVPAAGPPEIGLRAATPARNVTRLPPPRPAVETNLTPEELVNVTVYENVNRSVVNIETEAMRGERFLFFEVPSEGAGSGSVLDRLGHILTNFHVVEAARKIKVTLFNGKEYEGRLVGKDESNDVAVVRIEAPAESLIPVVLGDSTHLRVGQRVFAIGNPFGLERTLTTGIISSLNRTLPARNHRTIKSIIQIDAAINPGNSGGPLLDSHGRLIGMNTAIASATGQSAGVGFAIPVANISRVVPQLIERGRVIRPDVGITRVLQTEEGLLIATMTSGGPAEQAGLRGFRIVKQRHKQGLLTYETNTIDRSAADLIVAVDGEKIVTANDFLSLVEAKQPGQEVTITVVRGGREVNVSVRLAAADS
ncbi:MAG: trypsin-like peptidase domain-containing protein [Planctomycetia bacterium]|nr:trypsin-like peptidase domain-containing protein [Planctomycetia bacterium]